MISLELVPPASSLGRGLVMCQSEGNPESHEHSVRPISEAKALQLIQELEALDLRNTSIEVCEEKLSWLMAGHLLHASVFAPGPRLFRARRFANSSPPLTKLQLGAPHKSKVSTDGRCNRRGESVFYCSDKKLPTLFEVQARENDFVALSTWELTSQLVVNPISYDAESSKRLGAKRLCPDWTTGKPLQYPQLSSQYESVNRYISNLFTQVIPHGEEYRYKVPLAICNILRRPIPKHLGKELNGLMYPSIALAAECENLAINTAFAERALRFVKVEYVKVLEINEEDVRAQPLLCAERMNAAGVLIWVRKSSVDWFSQTRC